jgi:hypothetical protein
MCRCCIARQEQDRAGPGRDARLKDLQFFDIRKRGLGGYELLRRTL